MIFKTIDADATKLTKQMGLLGKSFNDIKKDYSNGLGLTKSLFSTSISESDWKSLQKFNSAIKVTNDGLTKSQRITKAWNDNMTGCSITAKRMGNDLVTGKKKISDVSAAMKTATTSTKGLEIAMNLVANVGFMLAISAITKVVSELAQAQSKAVETAKEATSSYNDELSSIKDYKEKISELTDELNSGSLSYEETKTKRSELMSIQDELIKKFGTEKSAIESVTEAIGGQVNALDDLNEKAYRDWIAKADDETIWTKLLPWGKSGLDQAIDYMESKKTISFFDMANANSTTQDKYQAPITDEIRSIQEEIDKTIQSKYNLEKEFATFKLTGTPEEIKSQLEAIRQDYLDLSKEAFLENGISSEYWDAYRSEAIESINDVINQFDKGLEKHQETYKTYIEGMIKYDSEYSDEYATILRKRAELEDAENSGDAEKIQTARQEFMDAIADGITASGSDENIKKYFESLYPELQSEFSNWNFEIAINANTDNLKTEAEEIGKQYSATDLLDMVNTDGIQDGEDAFNKLIDKAIEYGVCTDNSAEEVQKLIDLLVELGIVQGSIESDVQHETPISMDISSTIDQLNTQLKPAMDSLKSAWKDIFSGDNGEMQLDEVDLLSTVDTIKSKLDELNKIEGITVDYSSFEDFVRVLEDTSSSENDVKEAFNGLATSIVNAGVSGAEDFETLKESLEDLGVVNNEIIAFQALVSNTEALKEAGLDLVDATDEQIADFAEEMVSADNLSQAIALLTYQKELCNIQGMNTSSEVANLKTLAENAGVTGDVIKWLTELEQIYQQVASGTLTPGQLDAKIARAEELKNLIEGSASKIKYEPTFDGSKGSKSASKAGKEAADAYLEAFEKELKQLEDDKNNGLITEKQYLDGLRKLYNKYFRDKKKYLDQYKKYERQYLEGMKSLYESAFSYLTSQIDKKIDAINDEKDAAVDALEAEKDAAVDALESQKKAAEEAYQSQIDLLEQKKKANDDAIKGIEDEIDAINDAADSRKRELDLQKAQYELEKLRNQRTILQYSEEKGMIYRTDTSGIRDAKENVDDAKREIQISDLEKEKKYYEDINDSIDEQIDSLNELIDKSNEYYDNLIEQTEKSYDVQIEAMEKYYDSLIEALKKQKEQFQSLTDIVEEAQMKALLQELGINEEALLNGSAEEFNKLRDTYLGIIKDMNAGNQGVLDAMTELSGVDMSNLTGYLDSTASSFDGLGSSMGNVADKTGELDNVGNSLGTVSDNAESASTGMGNLKTATEGLDTNLSNVSQQLSDINTLDGTNIDAYATAFNNLADAIQNVAAALGIGAEDSVGGLLSTLQNLNEITLGGEEGEGIISQFENLKAAIDEVSSAIGGGSGGGTSGGNGDPLSGGTTGKKEKSSGGTGGDPSSITGALNSLKSKADEVLGEGSEDNSEGSGVIGQFGQLKGAVDDVSSAIGLGEGSGGEEQNSDESTLTGAITGLGTTAEEILGEPGGEGVIGRFEQFKDVIGEANEHVTGISDGLEAIDGQEVECTIKVNIETTGSLPSGFGAWTGTAMNLESGSYNAKYGKGFADGTAHVEGTAKVTGDWAVHQGGQSLLGELGREIIVRNGRFFTVGENGAEMHNLQPGDIVFNHVQTEELLKNGHISSRGKAYANGTTNNSSILDRLRAQGYNVQEYQWKDMHGNLITPEQMNEAAKAWMSGTYECLTPMNDFKEKIKETVRIIEGANIVNNVNNKQQPINQTINVALPNVTDKTSATELLRDLESLSTKKLQYNWKK